MTVKFFRLRKDGPEAIGTITMKDGVLVADPADAQALRGILAKPLEVYQEDGPVKPIDPTAEPEAFLKGCLETFRGSYFWCKQVED
jgi:hypothetical protein